MSEDKPYPQPLSREYPRAARQRRRNVIRIYEKLDERIRLQRGTRKLKMEHTLNLNEEELAHCTVCNGAEGSLPTECPGRRMTEEEDQAVFLGDLDYKDGKWTK